MLSPAAAAPAGSSTRISLLDHESGVCGSAIAGGRACGAGHGFKSLSIRCGSSPITLPGLSWSSGSNASLISRKTWASSPYCLRRNWVRASPQACAPLIVPPASSTMS